MATLKRNPYYMYIYNISYIYVCVKYLDIK